MKNMEISGMKMKKKKWLAAGVLLALCIGLLGGCGGKKTGAAEYVKDLSEFKARENVRIYALGEATHGNAEFQQLKLEVLEQLVAEGVRGFVLEADFGGCRLVNRYVTEDIGDAKTAVDYLMFRIYRTNEMEELLQWIHDYNQQAEEKDQIRFYGMDIQSSDYTKQLVEEFYDLADESAAAGIREKLEACFISEGTVSPEQLEDGIAYAQELIQDMDEKREAYIERTDEETFAFARQSLVCLVKHAGLLSAAVYAEYRDEAMYENVNWILEREEELHQSKIMISAHNGHVTKAVSTGYINLGSRIYKEYQDAYYVIGTDYDRTSCNLPDSKGNRANHSFASGDPIAKELPKTPGKRYLLQFSDVPQGTVLYDTIHEKMKMGSLGEQYSLLIKLIPQCHRIERVPADLYDAMIFVKKASPTNPWPK
ncbi:MAG: erythromycin esterase family protein [Lachnospiraceae bacterium]|nr:erythromycin esterase family protein [Lachnospiraceae bacterium]